MGLRRASSSLRKGWPDLAVFVLAAYFLAYGLEGSLRGGFLSDLALTCFSLVGPGLLLLWRLGRITVLIPLVAGRGRAPQGAT